MTQDVAREIVEGPHLGSLGVFRGDAPPLRPANVVNRSLFDLLAFEMKPTEIGNCGDWDLIMGEETAKLHRLRIEWVRKFTGPRGHLLGCALQVPCSFSMAC
jgi:hypothetical protein